MADESYVVVLRVKEKDLGTVISTLAGVARISYIKPDDPAKEATAVAAAAAAAQTAPAAPAAPAANTRNGGHRFWGGKKNKGISGPDLLLNTLKAASRPMSRTELRQVFQNRGFSPNSADPAINKAQAKGVIRAIGNGMWVATGHAVIHKGAGAS